MRRDPLLRFRRLGFLYLLVRRELTSPVRLAWTRRLRAWSAGFASHSWVLYDLDRNDRRQYVRPTVALNFRHRLPRAMSINDKLLLPLCLERLGVAHPRSLGFLHRGWVHAPGGAARDHAADWLAGPRPAKVVMKPIDGANGRGILFVFAGPGGASLEINGVATALDAFLPFLGRLEHYVITEFAEQAPYAAALNPGTTNTVRVLTLWDEERGEPFLAAAAHRLGRAHSRLVDNFNAGLGGLSARIDLETGELGTAAGLGPDGRLHRHPRHPDTGAPISGVRVAGWPGVAALALGLARALPESPFVGWDIVVTADGPLLLEANAPPGLDVWQVHEPLLAEPRRRRFFAAHGIA